MEHEQIMQGLAELLSQHNRGLRGSIHQEPYKGDLFKLFAAAFNAGLLDGEAAGPLLTADAMADSLAERACPNGEATAIHYRLLEMWSEWTYAWRHSDQLQRLAR